MLPLHAAAIFLAALLLFLVQPMIGKLVLPLLGGSPSVWNTVMLFFQSMLLAGYAYAHALAQLRGRRAQLLIHSAVLIVAALLLPIGLPAGEAWRPDLTGYAPFQVLLMLAAACAGPVFVLCSASPLLQAWFAGTSHRTAGDPYYLYAASNLGSMTALLGYPLLVEPHLTLTMQRHAWSAAFAVLAGLILACAVVARRSSRASADGTGNPAIPTPRPAPIAERDLTMQRLLWIALAFVPAGLMMGATQHITIDIAPVPLLWVLPLAIYLFTYILAFAKGGPTLGRIAGWLLPPVVVGVAVMAIISLRTPTWLPVGAHLLLLLLAAMTCHGRLARLRPDPARLTEFYLLLSVGGVLAGIICGITAPAVFNGILEYPLFIVAACLLREPWRRRTPATTRHHRRRLRIAADILLWILVISIVPFYVFIMVWLLGPRAPELGTIRFFSRLTVALLAALTMVLYSRRWMHAAAVLALLSIPWFDRQIRENEILQIRTFFGVHRVVAGGSPEHRFHRLIHGRTEHGRQWRTPPFDKEPLAYFTRSGPVGDVFARLDSRPGEQRIAIIGLGAGTLAAYGRPDRAFTFYEIDPVVKDIATDPDLFSYTTDSRSPVEFVLGDARLTIAAAPDAAYDLIAMDAFSSDAVPVHLITREAVRAYLSKLSPHGLLMFNVSNLYINFESVLSRLAEDAGLIAFIRDDRKVPIADINAGKQPSAFIVLARSRENLGPIADNPLWRPLNPAPHARLWTDDYSDILSVVKWR